jgi:hypothetical protein
MGRKAEGEVVTGLFRFFIFICEIIILFLLFLLFNSNPLKPQIQI